MHCGARPDALRHDEAGDVYVATVEWSHRACGAFRRGEVVDEPAFAVHPGLRVGLAAVVLVLVMVSSGLVRAAMRDTGR
jgi:hypothetical protein